MKASSNEPAQVAAAFDELRDVVSAIFDALKEGDGVCGRIADLEAENAWLQEQLVKERHAAEWEMTKLRDELSAARGELEAAEGRCASYGQQLEELRKDFDKVEASAATDVARLKRELEDCKSGKAFVGEEFTSRGEADETDDTLMYIGPPNGPAQLYITGDLPEHEPWMRYYRCQFPTTAPLPEEEPLTDAPWSCDFILQESLDAEHFGNLESTWNQDARLASWLQSVEGALEVGRRYRMSVAPLPDEPQAKAAEMGCDEPVPEDYERMGESPPNRDLASWFDAVTACVFESSSSNVFMDVHLDKARAALLSAGKEGE